MRTKNRWAIQIWCVLAVFVFAGPGASRSFAADRYFSFDSDGVYPSSQGAVNTGTLPESVAFAVAGGLLLQDTTRFSFAQDANYTVPRVFDHNIDAALEFRVRLIRTTVSTQGGLNVSIRDNTDLVYARDWGI